MHSFKFLFFITYLLIASTSFAETLYVKKSGTALNAEPSGKSATVALLDKDTAVESINTSGKFIEVKSGSLKGWIFKFKLTDQAPKSGDGSSDLLEGLLGKQEVSAQEASSSSSIRGLSPISEKHARDTGISENDILAVKVMEGVKATPAEVVQFLKQRKLGEYSN
jgi:hypothetical protein